MKEHIQNAHVICERETTLGVFRILILLIAEPNASATKLFDIKIVLCGWP
jgi:hypothetical protein